MTSALLFIAGLALLYVGGEGLVRGAAAVGVRCGMSPLVAGLTIVAFATSAPELAVTVDAALRGETGLSVGNVIGSNICNIALILGLTAVIKPPQLKGNLVRRDVLVMLLSTLCVPALLIDGVLSRLEGFGLLAAMAVYIALTIRHSRRGRDANAASSQVPELHEALWVNVAITALSLGVLIFGSELFVEGSIRIAAAIGLPSAVIGLSAAALGTSLPEVTTSIIAARHGEAEMAAGNLIGSNIFNLLLILGIASLVRPLTPDGVSLVDVGFMIAVSLFALSLMVLKTRVARPEGALLVASYLGYLIWLFS